MYSYVHTDVPLTWVSSRGWGTGFDPEERLPIVTLVVAHGVVVTLSREDFLEVNEPGQVAQRAPARVVCEDTPYALHRVQQRR